MLKIFYDDIGSSFSDFEVTEFLDNFIELYNYKEEDYQILTSTENLIFAVRTAIYEGKIDSDHVILVSTNSGEYEEIIFDNKGRVVVGKYPLTHLDKSLDTLIGLGEDKNV